MDLYDLKVGDRVRLFDGPVGEVLSETEDGQWIRVRYIESPLDRALLGTDDLCHLDELRELVSNGSTR